MTYRLTIGDWTYSSWSMRGWLLLEAFGLPFETRKVPMYTDAFDAMQAEAFPARTVPMLEIGEPVEARLWDTLAIAETLAERHPDAGHWPKELSARTAARALAAEMHASFHALRDRPSMNLAARYEGFEPTDAELADADRVQALWAWALGHSGGPYLFGNFCAADAMFAPVATRFVTYGFALDEAARGYVEAIYAHPAFRRWHACADADPRRIERYHLDLPESGEDGWPRAPRRPARRFEGEASQAVNDACPYSGRAVAADSLAEIDGRVIGFCNPFCCAKSIADADAWPKLAPLLEG